MSTLRVNEIGARTGGVVTIPAGSKMVGTEMGSVYAPGQVIQVQNSISGPVRYTFSSLTPQVIPGLSIAFTPKLATSTILIMVSVSGTQTHVNGYGIYKDGVATVSTAGQTNNNEPNFQATQYLGTNTTDWIYQVPLMHYETSGSTTPRTYAVYVTSGWAGTTYTTYVNNRASNDMASFSYITIMEIAQ